MRRALLVVVGDELPQEAIGMASTADEHPVQALGPDGPYKSFRARVRPGHSEGCPDDPCPYRSHHFVKRANELTVPVPDKEAERSFVVIHNGNQVPGLLGGPGPDRVSGQPGQVDRAALQVDKEQDINATQGDRTDVGKIARKRASRLRSQELRKRRACGPGRRS
jgi:hypothetical protein